MKTAQYSTVTISCIMGSLWLSCRDLFALNNMPLKVLASNHARDFGFLHDRKLSSKFIEHV
jgi:hypothetical protein